MGSVKVSGLQKSGKYLGRKVEEGGLQDKDLTPAWDKETKKITAPKCGVCEMRGISPSKLQDRWE